MKPISYVLFSLALVPAFATAACQETSPIIPVPPPPAQAAPATAAAVGGKPASPPAVSPDYMIGIRDGLSISVWKEPQLSGSVEVRPDGMISLPLLGDVKADGFTPTALGVDLTERLKKFVNDPLVTVTILAINSKHIYLTGYVGHGGELAYSPDMTPMQVIISAGGVTPYAKEKKIYILRTVNGKQVKIPFDFKKALKTGDQQGVTLQPNDTIVVP